MGQAAVKRLVFVFLAVFLLTGCESLKLRNLGKTTATTAVTYAIGGPIPAAVNAGTSMAYDEIIPQEAELKDIKTTEQTVAYLGEKFLIYGLIGGIVFLLITNILVPFFASKRGYARAKDKYTVRVSKELAQQIKELRNE